jgi:transcriptional antiterminator NusG
MSMNDKEIRDETTDESAGDDAVVEETAMEEAVKPEPKAGAKSKSKAGAETKTKSRSETKTKSKPAPEAVAPMAVAPVEADSGLPKKWYVVHTYSGHENKVRENVQKMVHTSALDDHFGQIIVPTEEVAEMKKGKKTITTRKFFPSYILVEMHMTDESWHLVNDMPGVTGFVGTASGPQPLSKPEVERILGRMDKEKQTIIPEIPFTLGEHIRIKDGPFSDFTGIVDEINAERGKLRVLVSIFGRETPVELDFLQVENI